MLKRAVQSSQTPRPFGCYSTAIQSGDMLFLAGQGPFDENQQLVGDDIAQQTHRTLQNIRNVLEENGYTMDDIVRATVFLSDISNWGAFNEVYERYFTPPFPARTVVGCQLNGFLVEIECTAVRGAGGR